MSNVLCKKLKFIIKRCIRYTPFKLVSIGNYLREKYFFRYMKTLPVQSWEKVLDAGCGSGKYTLRLARAHPHIRITGCDIKEHPSWDNPPKNVRFRTEDLLQLSAEERYDLCLCVDVLEHIPGNRKVVQNIFRVLKSGGYLYLHMPRPEQHHRQILPGRFLEEFDKWAGEEHIGERYTLEEIQSILRSIGFSIFRAHCTFNFWGRLAWELDKATNKTVILRVLLMPLLKIFANFDILFPKSNRAAILVIAMKPTLPFSEDLKRSEGDKND